MHLGEVMIKTGALFSFHLLEHTTMNEILNTLHLCKRYLEVNKYCSIISLKLSKRDNIMKNVVLH